MGSQEQRVSKINRTAIRPYFFSIKEYRGLSAVQDSIERALGNDSNTDLRLLILDNYIDSIYHPENQALYICLPPQIVLST